MIPCFKIWNFLFTIAITCTLSMRPNDDLLSVSIYQTSTSWSRSDEKFLRSVASRLQKLSEDRYCARRWSFWPRKVPWGSFIKISWQYRGYVAWKVRRGEFRRRVLLKSFTDFVVLTATVKFNPGLIPRFR